MVGESRTSAEKGTTGAWRGGKGLRLLAALAAVLAVAAAVWWWQSADETAPVRDERPLGPSGLPLPRFVSISAGQANLRKGPGREYPIAWVYTRRHWPLKIVREYGVWREVEDIDGTRGWMHAALLSGRRYGVIRGEKPVLLRARPRPDSAPLYRAEPGVLVRILNCTARWCRVRITGGKAWIPKTQLWGVLDSEIVD